MVYLQKHTSKGNQKQETVTYADLLHMLENDFKDLYFRQTGPIPKPNLRPTVFYKEIKETRRNQDSLE